MNNKFIKIISLIICLTPLFYGCVNSVDNYPDKIIIKSGNNQCVPPSSPLPKELTVQVLGPHQKGLLGGKGSRDPVKDVKVNFYVTGQNTNLCFPMGISAITDPGGLASIPITVGKTLGDIYVKAEFKHKSGEEKSAFFRLISGIEISGDKQEALAGHTCSKPLTVKVFNKEGNPAINAEVFFTTEKRSPDTKLSDTYVHTDKNGIAKTFVTVGKKTKTVGVTAEVVANGQTYRSLHFSIMGLNQTGLIISLLVGLAIFIFGMTIMADSLQRVAGPRLKDILQLFVRNRFVGVLVGTGVTAVIQSSSACTVMVVGFVNAGLLTLRQAISVIFGSSIGTTVTAQIIAFKLTKLALPAVIIGLIIQMVSKKSTTKFWGLVLLGFGLLFLGMGMMSDTLIPLRTSPTFISFFQRFDCTPINGIMPIGPVLCAILIGTLTTMVVQSSSATVGLVMALAMSGLINFYTAIPLILGDNIGTTITANLAAIGANRNARRSAIANTLMKVSGTATMLFLFYVPYKSTPVFLYLVNKITSGNVLAAHPENISRHIAMAHTIFNVINVVVLLPFIGALAWLCEKIVPIRESEQTETLQYLEPHLLNTPSLAIGQTTRELAYMTRRSVKMVEDSYKCLKENNLKWEDDILRREEIVDDLQDQITEYLAKLTSQMLTEKESKTIPIIMHAVHDVERIGDLAINILELAQRRVSKKLIITEDFFKLIDEVFDEINAQCNLVFEGLHSANPDLSKLSIAKEEKVNALHKRISSRILKDYNPKSETVRSTVLILDVLANLERIGDHLVNIAERIPAIVLFEPE